MGLFRTEAEEFASLSPGELAVLCQEARAGDTRPFEALVARYKQTVFATAYRMMGNRHDAEDQAQEVFLKIYRNIKHLKEPATLTSWVYRITINSCRDALQQQRSPATTQIDVPDDEGNELEHADTRTPSPQTAIEHGELRGCLEKTLASLGEQERSVLILRDVEDRPYQEIAEALGVGLSAVKMRIHRARLAFQKLLDRVCPGVARARSPDAPHVIIAGGQTGLRTQDA